MARIIIVGSENTFVEDLKNSLENMAHEVVFTTRSFADVLDKSNYLKPDLILMDTALKGNRGNIVTEGIKKLEMPLIFFADDYKEFDMGNNLLKDHYSYLLKKYDRKELEYTIKLAILKQELEQRSKEIIQSSPVPQFVIDSKHRVIYWNKAMEEYSGVKSSEIVGTKDHCKPFYPNKRPCLADLLVDGKEEDIFRWYQGKFKKSKLLKDAYEGVDFFQDIGNEGKWLYFTASPIKDTNNNIVGAVETFVDITDRKNTEKDLITSENKYRALFDNADDGIFLLEGKYFIECNKKVLEMYEVSRDQIIGKTPVNFSPELQSDGERSDDKANKFINLALQGNPQRFEWKHIRKDGTPFYTEVTLNRLKIEGNYLVQAIVRDVTQRKETENLLKESENRYKMVGNLISDFAYSCVYKTSGIYEIDWITNSFYHMTGFTKNQLELEKCWLFSVHPDDDKIAHDQLKELKAGSRNVSIFRIKDVKGEVKWIKNHVQCVEDNDSGRLRIYGAAQDITQLKEREDTIKKSLQEKDILLQEIHHRVKNNMQVISSLLSLQSQYVDEDLQDILEGSRNRVKSMALVHEKLYRSHNLSRIDMVDYIQNLVSDLFYSHRVDEDCIKMFLEIDDIEFNIETAIPCGLIINELVSNALKYAFPQDKCGQLIITLQTKADNDDYELIIQDNGVGLPADFDINKIDSLGLQLVYSLIKQLDGKIELEIDYGTVFKITFPEMKYKTRI
nr:PAS domain S-box protein [Methanobacterium alcaliphilum]